MTDVQTLSVVIAATSVVVAAITTMIQSRKTERIGRTVRAETKELIGIQKRHKS